MSWRCQSQLSGIKDTARSRPVTYWQDLLGPVRNQPKSPSCHYPDLLQPHQQEACCPGTATKVLALAWNISSFLHPVRKTWGWKPWTCGMNRSALDRLTFHWEQCKRKSPAHSAWMSQQANGARAPSQLWTSNATTGHQNPHHQILLQKSVHCSDEWNGTK